MSEMKPLEMIAEWRKGCSVSVGGPPEECTECTVGLIDALERALMWQSIETAPKDGSIILLGGGNFFCEQRGTRIWSSATAAYVEHSWLIAANEGGYCWITYINPTHWMPRPEPPK